MKRSSVIIFAVAAVYALTIGFLKMSSFSTHRYDEALDFAQYLEEEFHEDQRFASLNIVPSTAGTIDITGPVASVNIMDELRTRVLALHPPVPTMVRLYVGDSNTPPPKDFGKEITWFISPADK